MSRYERGPEWGKRWTEIIPTNGLPPPEKWRGLKLAETIGENGYTVDTFIEDTRKMIGFETWCGGSIPDRNLSDRLDESTLSEYAYGYGNDNPLYTDPEYARNTRYGGLIGSPTILAYFKYSLHRGAITWGPYPLSELQGAWAWEWNDVIRVGDRVRKSCKLKNVFEKKGRTGRLVFMSTDLSFWNQHDDLFAIGGGYYINPGRDDVSGAFGKGGKELMLYERPTYHYSKEEVEKIVAAIRGEERRGATPRYWEDVNVGDKLTPIVKGPQTFGDFLGGSGHRAHPPGFELRYHQGVANPAAYRVNPITGWPYEHFVMEHYDFNLCRGRGLPGPFDVGNTRVQQVPALLSNWMGDDGFIRRISAQIRKPNYYGDTCWFYGEVVNKRKDKLVDVEYAAVDLVISVMNQVGENTLPTKATVYLPSRELGEITLPVPNLPEEEWKLMNRSNDTPDMTTKYHLKDFFEEIDSGESLFPYFPYPS